MNNNLFFITFGEITEDIINNINNISKNNPEYKVRHIVYSIDDINKICKTNGLKCHIKYEDDYLLNWTFYQHRTYDIKDLYRQFKFVIANEYGGIVLDTDIIINDKLINLPKNSKNINNSYISTDKGNLNNIKEIKIDNFSIENNIDNSNITQFITLTNEQSYLKRLENQKKYPKFSNVKYICGSNTKNFSNFNNYDIIDSYNSNYGKYNSIIRNYSSYMYILENIDNICNTDYIMFNTCGWFYNILKKCKHNCYISDSGDHIIQHNYFTTIIQYIWNSKNYKLKNYFTEQYKNYWNIWSNCYILKKDIAKELYFNIIKDNILNDSNINYYIFAFLFKYYLFKHIPITNNIITLKRYEDLYFHH